MLGQAEQDWAQQDRVTGMLAPVCPSKDTSLPSLHSKQHNDAQAMKGAGWDDGDGLHPGPGMMGTLHPRADELTSLCAFCASLQADDVAAEPPINKSLVELQQEVSIDQGMLTRVGPSPRQAPQLRPLRCTRDRLPRT